MQSAFRSKTPKPRASAATSAPPGDSPDGVVTDPVAAAQAARLRYVEDWQPGIFRKRNGKGFVYVGADGKLLTDADELRRIRALVIPPAWTSVWICPWANGHVQATGRDARGRKQYRYHPRWREVRDENKYARMIAFAEVLPRLRRQVEHDLALPGLPRAKVLAAVVKLLESTCIRVGNEEYAQTNNSFGLATFRDRHVKVSGRNIRFEFRGKSGISHAISLEDPRLARIIKRCQDLPGYELFQYLDESSERVAIEAADVNAYLREIAGAEITTKDFRTWAGTVLAACAFWRFTAPVSNAEAKRNVVRAIDEVAKILGNTKAVCRKCYIHPAVIDAHNNGSLLRFLNRPIKRAKPAAADAESQTLLPWAAVSGCELTRQEAAVLALLREQKRDNDRRSSRPVAGRQIPLRERLRQSIKAASRSRGSRRRRSGPTNARASVHD
jgi:DNA topoisomerase I